MKCSRRRLGVTGLQYYHRAVRARKAEYAWRRRRYRRQHPRGGGGCALFFSLGQWREGGVAPRSRIALYYGAAGRGIISKVIARK